jgi:hypothetical protein
MVPVRSVPVGSVSSQAVPVQALHSGPSLRSGRLHQRLYRLVDRQGQPHPVLDDLYDSLDAAWSEAMAWWQQQFGSAQVPVEIGVEVSTASGDWRTLRFPGS